MLMTRDASSRALSAMTREQFDNAVSVAGAKVARRTLKRRLLSKEDVFEAFTNKLEVLHNSTYDVNVGNLKDAAKVWLLKKPKRQAKAEALDTDGMLYLLG